MKYKHISDFTTGVTAIVEGVLKEFDFQRDVLDIQVDATLDPGASPAENDRYIISAPGALHANFGTIDTDKDGVAITLGANDIVEYDGSKFFMAFDSSSYGGGEGALVYDQDSNRYHQLRDANWELMGIDFEPLFNKAVETVHSAGTINANTDFEVEIAHSKKSGFWYIVNIENFMLKQSQILTPTADNKVKMNVPFDVLAAEDIDIYYFY